MSDSILPPNATHIEQAAASATTTQLPVPNGDLFNPEAMPAAFFPWLAGSLSVDVWDSEWTEEVKRRVLRATVLAHRRKGTIAAIRETMRAMGFGNFTISEGTAAEVFNGAIQHDGGSNYSIAGAWAEYSVFLARPITNDQAAVVRRILARVAPARCQLQGLYYSEAAIRYNGVAENDGTYNHGAG